MGDQIADLPHESDIPPLPPKTYQWEDIRRQKLEGRYPWTHFYKEPFDDKKWEEAKEHEYEPVIPMDIHKSPPPIVKITPDRECPLPAACQNNDSREPTQDKNHLLVPPTRNEYDDAENGDDDSDSDDPSEEITAEELQLRLEEKYFHSPSPSSSSVTASTKHEYELTETRNVSPAFTDDRPSSSHSMAGDNSKLPHKMQLQADKLRRRFKNFKEQISKEYRDCSPRTKRKASLDNEPEVNTPPKQSKPKVRKQPKRNKFNFRQHAHKKSAAPTKLPSEPNLRDSDEQSSPQSSFRRFSFRSLRSLRRSPSNSSSVRERKRSLSSESTASKKKFDFHFGTYPRSIFKKRSKKIDDEHPDNTSMASKPKSAPGTPMPRRSPFSQGWMRKLTMERKKHPKEQQKTIKSEKKDENIDPPDTVVKETIFISLHEDAAKRAEVRAKAQSNPNPLTAKRPNSPPGLPPTPPETAPPTSIEIDNKNFFFISLHEERFPDKLHEGNSHPADFSREEMKIERELKKAQTARKFHHMLRKLETDRKLKTRRGENDDQPEPVVITEMPADDEDDGFRSAEVSENCVQTPEEEDVSFGKYTAEDVPPEKLSVEEKESTGKSEILFKSLSKIEIGKKVGWDKLKFGKRSSSREKDIKKDLQVEDEEGIKLIRELPRETQVHPTIPIAEIPVHINPVESPLQVNGYYEVEEQSSQPEIIPERAEVCLTAPQKMPRKKLKPVSSERESKESLSAFEDSTFVDAVLLDEQKLFPKTYIKASLDEIPLCLESVEPEQTTRQFKEYEKALEKSRTYKSIELKNNFYSPQNTLARLETPMPPNRPNRKGTLTRTKREKSTTSEHKENVYDLEANKNFNTFPLMKPDKPRRKLRKRRTYSNSTNNTENTEIKNIEELEDDAINQNIVNSKQLSVSFLPLTSNIVGEPITDYNLRETSSMIHLNFNPPLPPKRRKGPIRAESIQKYNTLPSRRYPSKISLSPSEAYNLDLNIDGEIEYADDVNSTIPDSDSPPKRPTRRRSTGPSTVDEDRTSRGIESISSERSSKEDPDFCDDDPKDIHGYAIIGKPAAPRPSQTQSEGYNSENGTSRRKSRRFSDFFTFPRIRGPTNYVTTTQTLDRRRLPSPSRPPRRGRPFREPTYTNDDTNITSPEELQINFDGEEQLNFNLATEEDSNEPFEDSKNLQTEDILEKMKARPLPPPPRPTRKPRDDGKNEHYSQSTKRKSTHTTNDLGLSVVEEKIINTTITTTAGGQRSQTESKNWLTNECSNLSTRFEQLAGVKTGISELKVESAAIEGQGISSRTYQSWSSNLRQPDEDKTVSASKEGHLVEVENTRQGISSTQFPLNSRREEESISNSGNDECITVNAERSSRNMSSSHQCLQSSSQSQDTQTKPGSSKEGACPLDDETTQINIPDQLSPNLICSDTQVEETHPSRPNRSPQNCSESTNHASDIFNSISASKLEISQLSVAKLSVGEIESSRLLTSTVDSSRLQVSSIQSEAGNLLLNAVAFDPSQSSPCSISGEPSLMVEQRDMTPSSDDAASEPAKQRPRISSMITEVGSDEEPNSKVTKVVRPTRRKQSLKRLSEASASCSYSSTDSDRPTLTDLMCQILQICHSSVGQAIHSMLEQIIPADREKRNEVQAAIWVMTIIVAGCLMLGLQSNEKIVHHHHWDFHFPPPH